MKQFHLSSEVLLFHAYLEDPYNILINNPFYTSVLYSLSTDLCMKHRFALLNIRATFEVPVMSVIFPLHLLNAGN